MIPHVHRMYLLISQNKKHRTEILQDNQEICFPVIVDVDGDDDDDDETRCYGPDNFLIHFLPRIILR